MKKGIWVCVVLFIKERKLLPMILKSCQFCDIPNFVSAVHYSVQLMSELKRSCVVAQMPTKLGQLDTYLFLRNSP